MPTPTKRFAVGVLPAYMLFVSVPLAVCESTHRNIERTLKRLARCFSPDRPHELTHEPNVRRIQAILGSAWHPAWMQGEVPTAIPGITLFLIEEDEWKPATTYHLDPRK